MNKTYTDASPASYVIAYTTFQPLRRCFWAYSPGVARADSYWVLAALFNAPLARPHYSSVLTRSGDYQRKNSLCFMHSLQQTPTNISRSHHRRRKPENKLVKVSIVLRPVSIPGLTKK